MTYAKAKLNILLKSNSCSLSNNFIVNETNSIIETINNHSTFEIISWELELLNLSYLNIILQTDNYYNSWKELKDIREESNNILNLLNTNRTFLINKWDFKIEKLIEDPKKSIEEITDNIGEKTKVEISPDKIPDDSNTSKTDLSSFLSTIDIPRIKNDITKKTTSSNQEEYPPKSLFAGEPTHIEGLIQNYSLDGNSGFVTTDMSDHLAKAEAKKEKKKSLRELILAFLKKNGPSSVKQITLGVLNMGLVTKSKSPRMIVNSMLWKLCRDERYRQKDKKGAYYNPVILDGDRWKLKK